MLSKYNIFREYKQTMGTVKDLLDTESSVARYSRPGVCYGNCVGFITTWKVNYEPQIIVISSIARDFSPAFERSSAFGFSKSNF